MLNEDARRQIDELFRRYGKGVGSYVLARVRDRDVAESLTAGVFLQVVRRFEQCRTSPAAWLWTIVRNELARYFRDRKATEPLDAEPADDTGRFDPTLAFERREAEGRLGAALRLLTEEQQALVYMKFFLDMSNVDIAEALKMTPSNVGVVAHRAIKRLRDVMEDREAEQQLEGQPCLAPA